MHSCILTEELSPFQRRHLLRRDARVIGGHPPRFVETTTAVWCSFPPPPRGGPLSCLNYDQSAPTGLSSSSVGRSFTRCKQCRPQITASTALSLPNATLQGWLLVISPLPPPIRCCKPAPRGTVAPSATSYRPNSVASTSTLRSLLLPASDAVNGANWPAGLRLLPPPPPTAPSQCRPHAVHCSRLHGVMRTTQSWWSD